MNNEVAVRVVLEAPNAGVLFGIQKGNGISYDCILQQQYQCKDIVFDFDIQARYDKEGQPDFAGPIVQGPRSGRFIYVDIGTYAGQKNTLWGRRLKVPLTGITPDVFEQLINGQGRLETVIPGKGKDGGPNCGTVKPFEGWRLTKK